MKINDNFLKLESSYLFSSIAKKVAAYQQAHPEADVIRLGIGDVTRPLAPAVIEAMHKAVDEMADEKTFRGYPPEYGYDFLLKAIQQNDYAARGVQIGTDEIFVSDGAKSDCGNIGDILDAGNRVAVCDPIYPVYVDTNIMAGRSGDKMPDGRFSHFIYMPCTQENGFMPDLPTEVPDMIYLCFPNNPTGEGATRAQLQKWVDYALQHDALILYDSAYEAFITEADMPLQNGRLHRRALRLHRGAQGLCVRRRFAEPAVGAPPGYQVQRRLLHHPACGRGGLQRGGQKAGARNDRVLPEKRPRHLRRFESGRLFGLGRRQLALRLAQSAGRHDFVGFLRCASGKGAGRRHAGLRLRSVRRGLFPPDRVRQRRKNKRGCRTYPKSVSFLNFSLSTGAEGAEIKSLPCKEEFFMEKKEQLYEGKAKKVFATDDENLVIVDYKDDATAFNGLKKGTIAGKGVVNNKMSNYLMQLLEKHGVPTHFVQELSDRETLVKKVTIVPLEVIIRNKAAGSICKRLGLEEGMEFTQPSLEFSYKDDDLGDPLINSYHAISCGFATKEDIDTITEMAFKVNDVLVEYFKTIGVELIDFKLEFGKTADGQIVLADEISPDTCRFWDIKTHEKLDKDRFRRDLGKVEDAYAEMMKRVGLN